MTVGHQMSPHHMSPQYMSPQHAADSAIEMQRGDETEDTTTLGMTAPLVSVIILNYNYLHYVHRAIVSVAEQTYDNIECVIIDDCSIDGSFQSINADLEVRADLRFRSIRLASNLGQMAAIKAGVENSTGAFIVFLDADDVLLPHFVERHVEAHLNGSYSAGITASDTIQIDENDQILETTFHTLIKHRTTQPHNPIKPIAASAMARVGSSVTIKATELQWRLHYISREMHGWHVVAMSSMMFRRPLVELILPDDTGEVRICADYYLVVYGHQIAGTVTIGERLSYFRLHQRNHFSVNPVMGGMHQPGFFSTTIRQKIEHAIARHAGKYVRKMGTIIGSGISKRIIRLLVPRYKLYRFLKDFPEARQLFGSKWGYFLKYGLIYRVIRRR
jgi:glycosyltransferase involved in cell wall biosynthesis